MYEASSHPPVLDAGGDGDEADVLLEYNAYVADRCNDTTAVEKSRCGREIQVTFFAARPPCVSYLCVFCRPAATDEHQEMIPMEPEVLATADNLVLLRIIVSPEKDLIHGSDIFVYRPAGGDGPSLKRLPRPAGGVVLAPTDVGILSCPANDDHDCLSLLRPHRAPQDRFYMVAALCDYGDWLTMLTIGRGRGRFVLHVYNSKLETWTATNVSVEDQHFQKYQDQGILNHCNTRVIAVGGEDATIAFVDLWRGILVCDLSHVKDKPWLRYVPLSGPAGMLSWGDACRCRDIAVVKGHFKFVSNRFRWKDCPTCSECIEDGWNSALWTRPVCASSLLDDSWQLVFDMESSGMDVKSTPDFELLPKLGDNNSPFQRLDVSHPTLSWNYSTDDTTLAWFMIKMKHGDAKAWVIAVDIINNRLQGVAEFDAGRYIATGYAYLHSRISKYLDKTPGAKEKLKRPGGTLLLGSAYKKLPGIRKPMQHDAGMEGMTEGGGEDMLLG